MKENVVMVEFYDSTHDPNWKSERDDFRGCSRCWAVGWKLQQDRKCVVLAMMRSDGGSCSERMIIPKGAIIGIHHLTRERVYGSVAQ